MFIKEISAAETLPIRHKAMWPDKPKDFVRVPGDDKAIHLGLFVNRKLISVVSVFLNGCTAQFRKFGTLPEFRNMGYGSKLLVFMIGLLKERQIQSIWCNARVERIGFYSGFGFSETPKTFFKSGKEYIVMERAL
ncbi:MAG: GNAT family N-acetyltransferase [Mongoliibacter sp.]|uniref:GNAT family N-acetyltransferase n=1 Tax=Mongoliibacter sp. TaxID=2022438 RepID=UPI0012EEF2D7|nr:GNAT family N-acetyltransferase [Mongoliibacter sp.]TVP52480.1 MAG: GNAT family N-acetyltransferase [Mongoliibacter sp.]